MVGTSPNAADSNEVAELRALVSALQTRLDTLGNERETDRLQYEAGREADRLDHEARREADRLEFLAQLAVLLEAIRLERAKKFGASREHNEAQYALFDEAESVAADEGDESEDDETQDSITVPAHTRTRAGRKPLPGHLPRVVIDHDPEHTHCECGTELDRIGTKTSEQLDIIPAQAYVIEHRRGTYKCPCCEDAVPATTPMPAQPIPKSFASPGLLAHVATAKYVDGLPLYRQEKQFARLGITLPRQTMASHMIRCGELIQPLSDLLLRTLRTHDVLQMDETRVQVLKEDGRAVKSQSWMWVLRGMPQGRPVVHFHYDPGRSAQVPMGLLQDYQGYLQTDGYAGYRAVLRDPHVRGHGCWAHARRKFIEAQQALPKGKSSPKLTQILAWIGKLYGLEKGWGSLSAIERKQARAQHSAPILSKIEAWLTQQSAPPKTLLGKALGYLRNEWPRLQVFLEDGRLPLDNNGVENAIRPFAIGRKNWLFCDSVKGARSSAALYGLAETALLNGVNVYAYFKWVFTQLPTAGGDDDLVALLPWNVATADLERMYVKVTD